MLLVKHDDVSNIDHTTMHFLACAPQSCRPSCWYHPASATKLPSNVSRHAQSWLRYKYAPVRLFVPLFFPHQSEYQRPVYTSAFHQQDRLEQYGPSRLRYAALAQAAQT